MRILELRFKNLNSLYGEWLIDFTHPEYMANGIVAFTGPTGSGKSTILDAICLALYGSTPRLGKVTVSENEIMSRQTGGCYAEVLFESQAGRFRCHWAQHRSRKKADGELQSPRHEIAEGGLNGKVIEHQTRRVAVVVEEKTGMNFDRFTRSILLAQGGFDTFLKAKVEEKSEILEQMTGTEIYSDISRRTHERKRSEGEKLKNLEAETSGLRIFEADEEKEIQQELEGKVKQEVELGQQSKKVRGLITWLEDIEKLKKEISSLSDESEKVHREVESFKGDRERLTQALDAAKLEGAYATLMEVRKQQNEDKGSLKIKEEEIPEQQNLFEQRFKTFRISEQQSVQTKEDSKQASSLIQKVRSIDQKLEDQKKDISNKEEGCELDVKEIESSQELKRQGEKKEAIGKGKLAGVEQYLKENSRDEWLVGGLAGIEERLDGLRTKQKELLRKEADEEKVESDLKQGLKDLEKCTAQHHADKDKCKKSLEALEQGKQKLSERLGEHTMSEYRLQKDGLFRESQLLLRIAKLEDDRQKLEDGKECPLCGSKEHPFAEGNVPSLNEVDEKIKVLEDLIQKAEGQEIVIQKLEKADKKSQENLIRSEDSEKEASHKKQMLEKDFSNLKSILKEARDIFSEAKKTLLEKLEALGIEKLPDSDISLWLGSLQDRLKKWKTHVEKKTEIEKTISENKIELTGLDAVIKTKESALAEKQETLQGAKKDQAEISAERQKLYEDKNPDTEEKRLIEAIESAETAEKESRKWHDQAKEKLSIIKEQVDSLKGRVKAGLPKLKKLESDFEASLVPTKFSDEKQFIEACLGMPERESLVKKAKALDDRKVQLKATQKDREDRLEKERGENKTEQALDELKPQFEELEVFLKESIDRVASLKHSLRENRKAKDRIKEKQADIDKQKKECLRWEKLSVLIGSSDGKKFRNFAQGLTFELMVSHANRQLCKMTDRYLLIRDPQHPLELNVVDNYQAGETRSTKNLSGGESFIVSLTLALGLSKMASRKVRVDSLFLDEGFGTLDEDALDLALEALSGLQEDGKLIGVISHVPALKERIPTQIKVLTKAGGMSELTGPGCSRLGVGEGH